MGTLPEKRLEKFGGRRRVGAKPLSHKDLSFGSFSLHPLDSAPHLWYNGAMLKAALIGVLAFIFLPAIQVALICAATIINYIPTLF